MAAGDKRYELWTSLIPSYHPVRLVQSEELNGCERYLATCAGPLAKGVPLGALISILDPEVIFPNHQTIHRANPPTSVHIVVGFAIMLSLNLHVAPPSIALPVLNEEFSKIL